MRSRYPIDLRRLRYFIVVAEELHFGHAAQRLHVSQPSLSLQIKALEKELGVPLFHRNRHHVSLSDAGRAALDEAYRALEQVERVRSSALEAEQGIVARLSVGCVPSAMFAFMPPILEKFHAWHPQIRLALTDLETALAVPAMLQGRIDAGLFRLDKVPAPLKLKTLMHDRFIVALHEKHPLAKRRIIPLKALAGEPLIIFARQSLPRTHDVVIAACIEAGFSPNIEYQATTIQSQIGLAACNMGIALVPSHAKAWNVRGVVYRELDHPVQATNLALVWNESSKSPAVDAFIETVEEMAPRLATRRH